MAARGAPSSSFLGGCAAQLVIVGDPTDHAIFDQFRDRVDLALHKSRFTGGLQVTESAACHFLLLTQLLLAVWDNVHLTLETGSPLQNSQGENLMHEG